MAWRKQERNKLALQLSSQLPSSRPHDPAAITGSVYVPTQCADLNSGHVHRPIHHIRYLLDARVASRSRKGDPPTVPVWVDWDGRTIGTVAPYFYHRLSSGRRPRLSYICYIFSFFATPFMRANETRRKGLQKKRYSTVAWKDCLSAMDFAHIAPLHTK